MTEGFKKRTYILSVFMIVFWGVVYWIKEHSYVQWMLEETKVDFTGSVVRKSLLYLFIALAVSLIPYEKIIELLKGVLHVFYDPPVKNSVYIIASMVIYTIITYVGCIIYLKYELMYSAVLFLFPLSWALIAILFIKGIGFYSITFRIMFLIANCFIVDYFIEDKEICMVIFGAIILIFIGYLLIKNLKYGVLCAGVLLLLVYAGYIAFSFKDIIPLSYNFGFILYNTVLIKYYAGVEAYIIFVILFTVLLALMLVQCYRIRKYSVNRSLVLYGFTIFFIIGFMMYINSLFEFIIIGLFIRTVCHVVPIGNRGILEFLCISETDDEDLTIDELEENYYKLQSERLAAIKKLQTDYMDMFSNIDKRLSKIEEKLGIEDVDNEKSDNEKVDNEL